MLVSARELVATALGQQLQKRRLLGRQSDVVRFAQLLIGFNPVESLIALHLDAAGRLICYDVVSAGTTGEVTFDIRRIILCALERGACGIIVVHNHPSGDPRPSPSDVSATRALVDATRHFNIQVHDHLIVARGKFRSVLRPSFDEHWS